MTTETTVTEQFGATSENTIQRLRASKEKYEAGLAASGERAGADYVRGASYGELKRLVRWADKTDDVYFDSFYQVACIMSGEDVCAKDIDKILREEHGDDIDEMSWINGFIDGVVSALNELEPKL